jgi:ABC-type phosphate transport system auxiliary subunit
MAENTQTFKENVKGQLEKAKSQMAEIEALTKGKVSQTELDTIDGLKNKKLELEKKLQNLGTTADTKAKAEIEADLAKLNALLGKVATNLKSQSASK